MNYMMLSIGNTDPITVCMTVSGVCASLVLDVTILFLYYLFIFPSW